MAPPAIMQPQSPTLIAGIKSALSDSAFPTLRQAMIAANDPIAPVIAVRTVHPSANAAIATAKAVPAAATTIRFREITEVLSGRAIRPTAPQCQSNIDKLQRKAEPEKRWGGNI
jgi:hypothetical protein